MFAVVDHVILSRLTSPGDDWKQKCLPALRIQAWLFQNQQLSQEPRDPLHSFECLGSAVGGGNVEFARGGRGGSAREHH